MNATYIGATIDTEAAAVAAKETANDLAWSCRHV